MIRSSGTVVGDHANEHEPDGVRVQVIFGAGDGNQTLLEVTDVVSGKTNVSDLLPKEVDDLIEVFQWAKEQFKTLPRRRRSQQAVLTKTTFATNSPESNL